MRDERRARELALQFLYQFEIRGEEVLPTLTEFLSSIPPAAAVYAEKLVKGCLDKKEELDAEIARHSENWDLTRMAMIDRNILLIAAFELLFSKDIPPKVAIDEAIEIAKSYGDADSPGFVNGVLDGIYRSLAVAETEGGGDDSS